MAKLYIIRSKDKLEHLTVESDEAIRNIASLYNADSMTVTNFKTTGDSIITGNLAVSGTFNLLPKGIIVAWTGNTAPAGWALCDGTGGTPDLRGKFIYGFGAGSATKIDGTGGAESETLNLKNLPPAVVAVGSTPGTPHFTNIDPQGWASINYIGGTAKPYSTLPPYYVLAYIMKL